MTHCVLLLQRLDDLPEIQSQVVLELRRRLRPPGREISGGAARHDHSGGAAAAVMGYSPRQPQYRGAAGRRSRLGRRSS